MIHNTLSFLACQQRRKEINGAGMGSRANPAILMGQEMGLKTWFQLKRRLLIV
jgi:hypothetical protein